MSENELNGASGRIAERAVGERSDLAAARPSREGVPDPELVERAKRRRFTAEYKLRILRQAEACTRPGEIGALLRREGLYTSHLTAWRKQREPGALGRPGSHSAAASRPTRAMRENAALAAAGRARRGRAGEGPQGDRDPGKRLSALGADARHQGREQAREHRAMIEQTVEELTPIIGTRPACRALGAAPATIYRRRRPPAPRPARPRARPARALTEAERAAVLAELHSERFADSSPAQVWATLLDEGRYLASSARCTGCWPRARPASANDATSAPTPPTPRPSCSPSGPTRSGPGTSPSCSGPAKWTYYYLYVILDVFSRYVVGWTVRTAKAAELAKELIAQATEQQQIPPGTLTVHADRGSSMTSKPVAFLLADLGVTKTPQPALHLHRQPLLRSQFKTLKYRPAFPRALRLHRARPSASAASFFDHYNHQHRHSGIGLMTPADRPPRPRRTHCTPIAPASSRGLRAHARTIRPPRTHTAARPDRGLDQQAQHRPGRSLNPNANRLIRLDRFRATLHRPVRHVDDAAESACGDRIRSRQELRGDGAATDARARPRSQRVSTTARCRGRDSGRRGSRATRCRSATSDPDECATSDRVSLMERQPGSDPGGGARVLKAEPVQRSHRTLARVTPIARRPAGVIATTLPPRSYARMTSPASTSRARCGYVAGGRNPSPAQAARRRRRPTARASAAPRSSSGRARVPCRPCRSSRRLSAAMTWPTQLVVAVSPRWLELYLSRSSAAPFVSGSSPSSRGR